ncbi:MAG TPA: mechanosensitive ion channel family protein [Candidatus Krumholzibacteria bacterium]|nr:mechanosensitive ion channel family protein [Candidatus Krumholzibacteria bacterium]
MLPSLDFAALIDTLHVESVFRAAVVLILGIVLTRLVGRGVGRMVEVRLSAQEGMVTRRLITWVLGTLIVVTALNELGFDLRVLLGAAGVLTVALGFASQTSASNLISGLFLMAERPFVVGDYIQVDDRTGEVLSIDLLSVKLRTFDNLLVRVPNEDIIKKHIVNLTHFPIRRVDLKLRVAYGSDMDHVREILARVADDTPLCMTEPEPLFVFLRMGESGIEFQYSIWGTRDNYLDLLNSMYTAVEAALRAEGIEVPLPKRSVVGARADEPVRLDTHPATRD